jgi:hypothetical protein
MSSKAVNLQPWFNVWRAPDAPAQDDPADMGTAFGLDLSMLQGAAATPASVPAERRSGWVRRPGPGRRGAA